MDEVLVGKAASMARCVARVREEHAASDDFARDWTRQDAALLNIERACQAAIAIANRLIARRNLPMPSTTRESFSILRDAGVLDDGLSSRLAAMVGFRNIAVHAYRDLDMAVVERVIVEGLDDLLAFADLALDL
jgi:uncharacterized protein YutE (UPF0331/DUF86 family)